VTRARADWLNTPLQYVKGVGPRRAQDLARAGLLTIEHFLLRFPLRYEDRAALVPVAKLRPGTTATVVAEVLSSGIRGTRRPGFRLFELILRDETGPVRAVFPNQAFLRDVFHPGQLVVVYGPLEFRGGGLQFTNPEYEIIRGDIDDDDSQVHTGRIVPVYEKIGSLTTRVQRTIAHRLIGEMPDLGADPIPDVIRRRRGLPDRREAVRDVHFPPAGSDVGAFNAREAPAQRRLIFEEFFLFQAGLLLRKRRHAADRKPHAIHVDDRIRESARRALPFKLTAGQKDALRDIVADMQKPQPMNRLLQGDVGAGKTVVALLAAVVAMENGLQVAFMAPTEILADQHYLNLRRMLESSRFRVALLTGSVGAAKRRDVLAEVAAGAVHLVVGTHALAEEAVEFRSLGFVIIDEQHRFGVAQRATLRAKGVCPDVLVMTATPIPRTLGLTVFGDLDVSVIRDLPPGRRPIATIAKPDSRRDEVYAMARRALEEGRQIYVVYPLVEESTRVELRAATAMVDHLRAEVFPEYNVGLLHGRLKSDEKDRVMSAFARGEVHVLASTTVIEVGVDVPNATVMIVEHAERFGLSQLHQLRGRVGRGSHASTCVLLYQAPLTDAGRDRIGALVDTNDGFVIAERDLAIRGPGDFFGTRQSGLPTLRMGDLQRDYVLMEDARREASDYLADPASAPLVDDLSRTWSDRFGLAGVG
jgi:ATP-dependent DNA helicase RecG